MMNKINERQNEEYFIRLLAAQRQLYSDYKRETTVWVLVVTLFTILGAVALSFLELPIAIGSILLVAIDFVIAPKLRQKREQAAQVQEMLDTDLLELPWNDLHPRPGSGLIDRYADKHLRTNRDERRADLQNWYERDEIKLLPIHQARIIAQSENLRVDSEQRRRYANWLTAATLLLIIILATAGFWPNWAVESFNVTPLLLFLPLLVLMLKNFSENRDAAERLDLYEVTVDALLRDTRGLSVDAPDKFVFELTLRSRELQTEIYRHRRDTPPVFDWVYKKLNSEQKGDAEAGISVQLGSESGNATESTNRGQDLLEAPTSGRLGNASLSASSIEDLGQLEARLFDTLLKAYPERTALERAVRFQFSEHLDSIADDKNQADTIFDLIRWAQSTGRFEELARALHEQNPGNEALRQFVVELA